MDKQPENRTIDEVFCELDQVIETMEKEGITLEDSFSSYQKGMELLKECNSLLDSMEKKLVILGEEGVRDAE